MKDSRNEVDKKSTHRPFFEICNSRTFEITHSYESQAIDFTTLFPAFKNLTTQKKKGNKLSIWVQIKAGSKLSEIDIYI